MLATTKGKERIMKATDRIVRVIRVKWSGCAERSRSIDNRWVFGKAR